MTLLLLQKFLEESPASIDLNIEKIYYTALINLTRHLNGEMMINEIIEPTLVLPK